MHIFVDAKGTFLMKHVTWKRETCCADNLSIMVIGYLGRLPMFSFIRKGKRRVALKMEQFLETVE
jgi:hypothetical protein